MARRKQRAAIPTTKSKGTQRGPAKPLIDGEILIGSSKPMQELRQNIAAVASTDLPVLITGEVGTGKTLVARLIHANSRRATGPFVVANLPWLSSGLGEAALFGHVKGAFTGAGSDTQGMIEEASGGVLFLDDLEETPVDIQLRMLRAIDSQTIRRIGGRADLKVDFRIVAAARSDLSQLGRGHALRQDFLLRIARVVVRVPPLRDRLSDLPELVGYFLNTNPIPGRPRLSLTEDALDLLKSYDFPGNVRELRAILERASVFSTGNRITAADLSLREGGSPTTEETVEQLRRTITDLESRLAAVNERTIPAAPIWQGRAFPTEGDYCFVLMPFGDTADVQRVYVDHVKPLLEGRCGLRCQRADDIYDISGVMQSVWEGINRARVIIADLTERNPNVFYELGIAHTLGKPVIMLTQSMDYVPFDLRHLRCIVYKYRPKDTERLEAALERTVKTVLSSTIDESRSLR